MTKLWLDFETPKPLRPDAAAASTTTRRTPAPTVLCMSYAFDDEDMRTWLPGAAFPASRARPHKGRVYAHNAAFERLIFWYVLARMSISQAALEQFYCTASAGPRQLRARAALRT